MVAKIINGKNIRAVLYYNENKVKHSEAELLMACGFPRDGSDLSFKNKLERFQSLIAQNERTKTNAMHLMLNFSSQDKVDNETMKAIALDYMQGIGFAGQPFLVYRHYDAYHPHLHIATVNIADGGQRLETHNLGRNESEKARKEIEITYGLVKAEDQKKEMEYLLRPARLQKARYGRTGTKATISAIVREVVGTYKFGSLPELNAILGQFNVQAYRGKKGTPMYEKGGLVYRIIDDDHTPLGVPIKASAIFSSPTLKNLELKYKPNQAERKPYAGRLKHQLDKALATAKSQEQFEEMLRRQGIRLLLRHGAMGQVYGATFIDNATRTIFNGSDLGKQYAAKTLTESLMAIGVPIPNHPSEEAKKGHDAAEKWNLETSNEALHPAATMPVLESFWDILTGDEHEESSQGTLRKKKKIQGLD